MNEDTNVLSDSNQVAGQADDIQEVTVPEGEQEAPMPSAEETGPESTDEDQSETEGDDLPESSSDRTREQFEKLKESNAELAKKLDQYERKEKYGNSPLDVLAGTQPTNTPPVDNYANLSQGQVDNIVEKYIDDEGNVDVNGLNKALIDANRRASSAEKIAQRTADEVRRAEEARQLEEAYKEAQWLNPQDTENFDEAKYNSVRDRLVRYWSEGKQPRLVEVAREIAKERGETLSPKQAEKQKAEAVKQYQETQTKKGVGSNVQSGKGERVEKTTLEDLRERSRRGDADALRARLSAYHSK